MRKVRDYDAELKALNERAKQLQQRRVQQFGELVEATGADALDPDALAGALLAAVAESDKGRIADWRKCGAEFFRIRTRKRSRDARGDGASGKAAAAGLQPGRSGESTNG
jgi:hypothetical protein